MNTEGKTKGYLYTIQVDKSEDPQGAILMELPLIFTVNNHDDLFDIVARMKSRNDFSEDEAAALAIGIKLVGEVMLNNKDNELFAPIRSGFAALMRGLKQGNLAAGFGGPGDLDCFEKNMPRDSLKGHRARG